MHCRKNCKKISLSQTETSRVSSPLPVEAPDDDEGMQTDGSFGSEDFRDEFSGSTASSSGNSRVDASDRS
jgi:hypothetical protein